MKEHAIVKYNQAPYQPAVTLDILEPSTISTMDSVRQELRIWALSLFFLIPEKVPRAQFSHHEDAMDNGQDQELHKERREEQHDNDNLMNDTNGDQYDNAPTMAANMTNHGLYERREQNAKTNGSTLLEKTCRRPTLAPLTLRQQTRRNISEPSLSPTESTLARLARITMDSGMPYCSILLCIASHSVFEVICI
jgi:hypothetical protein